MSAWAGKYVIGLTGNIATGKSVVRKMLEHLGAYGIDADALGHRAIAKGAPGYKPVVSLFGTWVLGPDGQIDRARLARVVFSDSGALEQLEQIVHPLVEQAIDILIRRSKQNVIVIEAIKLYESSLQSYCDSIWVTLARQEIQLARLMQKRGFDEANARYRINVQTPQEQKTADADIIIHNDGSFENTWRQVNDAWLILFPAVELAPSQPSKALKGEMTVQRAGPRDAGEIAKLITYITGGKRKLSRSDVMAAFGEKAFLILKLDGESVGLVGWKVENLVACTDDVYIETQIDLTKSLRALMNEVERASRELQCEISLLFLPRELNGQESSLHQLGYRSRSIQSLGVRAWQEAASESMPNGTLMLFKQLRQDRVLRPV
jgi:dephospho-CoA kinase